MKVTVKDHREMGIYCDRLMQVSFDKGPLVMEHNRKKDARTLSQNKLYHWWIDIIANDQGNDHDDQGQIMMKHLIPPTHEVKKPDGTMEEAWSTTKLTVAQMTAYMDKIDRWAAGEGIFLPHPTDMQKH